MESVTVELGERTYTFSSPPGIKRAQDWRAQLGGTVSEIFDILEMMKDLEISRVSDVITLAHKVRPLLLSRLNEIPEWLISYSPVLEKDRDYIMENAYEEQIYPAFFEVLKLAFPFGKLLKIAPGLALNLTTTNSAEPSGASTETT